MTQPISTFHYAPPAWATGTISPYDAAFLTELVQELAPTEMVEVGVASGCSSAVLLHALASVHGAPNPSKPWLYSFDPIDFCYFDPARPLGAAVDELAPDLRPAWRLTIDKALGARQMLRGRELTFAFIDADHRHPWATLDLLALLPVLRQGAWVALHDIRLSQLSSAPEYQVHGAEYLFDAWPWTKRVEAAGRNIGACRLDAPLEEVAAYCLDVLKRDWEACPSRDVWQELGLPPALLTRQVMKEVTGVLHRALANRIDGRTRPLIIWGAGQAGRDGLVLLKQLGFQVDRFVDRDVRKQAGQVDGLDVRDPASLQTSDGPPPFVVACGVYAGEIARDLEARGLTRGEDFVCLMEWS